MFPCQFLGINTGWLSAELCENKEAILDSFCIISEVFESGKNMRKKESEKKVELLNRHLQTVVGYQVYT